MKREIKFRAWNKDRKKMREVAEMSFDWFPSGANGATIHGKVTVWDHPSPTIAMIKGHTEQWLSSDFELMQFTGQKDKKGVEIYEGDVVEMMRQGTKFIGVAKWGHAGFFIYNSKQVPNIFTFSEIHDEVVGNIKENPELMSQNDSYKK